MMTLKNVLLVNGASSGVTGIILVVFAKFTSTLFEVPAPMIFMSTGLFLVGFALFVIVEALRQVNSVRNVQLIIVLDALWVLASLVVLVIAGATISAIGNILILAVALWVLLMAILQRKGLNTVQVK